MKLKTWVFSGLFSLSAWSNSYALTMNHPGMSMDDQGMIMNDNPDKLPKDCPQISKVIDLTIRAGRKHAERYPGKIYAFDQQQWDIPGCAKLNITLINDDKIRHQLMIHGLPGYLYPNGMFTIEIYGEAKKTAAIILPSRPKTYLVHCEVPQHTEKGMKAQLKVAGGDGDLPSIPGLTPPAKADHYPIAWNRVASVSLILAILLGASSYLAVKLIRRPKNKNQI